MIKSDIKSEKKRKEDKRDDGIEWKGRGINLLDFAVYVFYFFLGRDLPRNSGNAERMRARARARERKR
jgi:hypothetical protein